MPSPFENDTAARALLERLRWPDGPQCPRCDAQGPEVFLIGGEKHSHREGLYHCKPCRKGFSVTVGTSFERLRIPLSTWVSFGLQ
jgi:transposase-like protein